MKITTEKLAALNTALKGTFKQAFEETPSDYEKVATTIPSSKKSNTYDWIGQTINLREWAGDRVIQNLTEYDYTIKNKKFEGTVAVKKDDIEDDEVGKYGIIMKELAYGAKTHPDSLIFGELLKNGTSTPCYDGQYFFDTDHEVGGESVSNFTTGSGAAWYLLNTARPLKPLIWQPRTPANLVTIDNEEAEPRL